MSNAGTNLVSEKFEEFCKKLKIHHALSSAYSNQSKGQAEACIKFVKRAMKKCVDTNSNANLALLQIRYMPIGLILLTPASILLNRPVRGLLSKIGRAPILFGSDDDHHNALLKDSKYW